METYKKCLETMYGLRRFGIILGLGTIKKILSGLGNPQKNFRSIHVAGTNGKGSVASTLAAIIKAAGYRVGLYTSPHVVHLHERIMVTGSGFTPPRTSSGLMSAFASITDRSSTKMSSVLTRRSRVRITANVSPRFSSLPPPWRFMNLTASRWTGR